MKQDKDTGSAGPIPQRRRGRMVQYIILAVGCVLIIDALVGDKGVLRMLEKRQEYRALERELGAARSRNTRLMQHVERLTSDPATVEDLARRELGLIKPGEKVFLIREAEPPDGRNGEE